MHETTRKSNQPSVLESMETRSLLSFDVAINFQPGWANVPAGVSVDNGSLYGPRADDLTYGWDRAIQGATRDRNVNTSASQRYDTLIHFGSWRGNASRWEIAVPSGDYEVRVVAGDPSYIDSYYSIQVEGEQIVQGAPSWNRRWLDGSQIVSVRDGRLTLANGPGAWNNKLSYISIKSVDRVRPDAPSNLTSSNVREDRVSLRWRDNAEGNARIVVEESRDGRTFSRIAELPGGSTSYTVDGLDAATTYHYRVRAANPAGASQPSNVVRVTTEDGEQSPPPTGGYFDGVTLSGNEDVEQAIPHLRRLGITGVRMWSDFDWDRHNFKEAWAKAIQYHDAGFHVTLLLQDDKVPTYDQAKNYFEFAVSRPRLAEAVDRWEIINEPNLWQYWRGTARQYVQNVLRAASDVFRPRGELVVGAATAWDTNYLQQLADAGYVNYVDFANYHPYGSDPEDQVRRIEIAKDVFAGVPLTLTEWNMHPWGQTREEWARRMDEVRPQVMRLVDSAFYFNLVVANTPAGPAGLLRVDNGRYVPNQPFYDTYDSWNV